ncbi:MAG: acyltransferase, partial [Acidimicrobiales bacterium]|nr:acyltransferase [Acidimicrobiales bacterium]
GAQTDLTGDGAAAAAAPERDRFIDFVRAFSLLVVVAWHWVFTIIIWRPDGPHASNPIGFTRGLFIATWLFQVMPLFFFVGGYAHTEAYEAGRERGRFRSTLGFSWSRANQLARPALALAFVWWLIGSIGVALWELDGVPRAVKLILSPLWFIIVYLLLILLFPITHWLHERFGALVLVWGVGISVLVDVARFSHHVAWAGWINMIVVWATCHQLGYFWERLVAAGRRVAWGMMWAGLFCLAALVGSNLYPGSMVGVPGEKFSNMAPPTICILALLLFQAGVALLVRPWVLHKLETSERWATVSAVINRFSLPLFLFHSTGMALWAAFGHFVLHNEQVREPTLWWWLGRPFAFIGPLLLTLPIIFVLGRQYVKPARR